MTAFINKVSGFETFNIEGINATNVTSNTIDFCFDASQIPTGFGVSSSDNHTFNFSPNAYYLVMASASFEVLDSNKRGILYSFFNKDTSTAIGKEGQNSSGASDDYFAIYAYATRFATVYIDGFDASFPSSGLNIGLSFSAYNASPGVTWDLSTSNFNYNVGDIDITTANQYVGKPTMMVFKSLG
jgi:hypothetical protein